MPGIPRARFPHPGTDRREDELERNLQSEHDAQVGTARAIETDRVADVDRAEAHLRADAIEKRIFGDRQLADIIAVALLALLCITIAMSVMSLVVATRAERISHQVQRNSAGIQKVCDALRAEERITASCKVK